MDIYGYSFIQHGENGGIMSDSYQLKPKGGRPPRMTWGSGISIRSRCPSRFAWALSHIGLIDTTLLGMATRILKSSTSTRPVAIRFEEKISRGRFIQLPASFICYFVELARYYALFMIDLGGVADDCLAETQAVRVRCPRQDTFLYIKTWWIDYLRVIASLVNM